jgi:predicted amidohydrolase
MSSEHADGPDEFVEVGQEARRGNLLGVQPFMRTTDYASGEAFRLKLERYLAAAARKNWLNERTVVVWPEYVGTWLAAADEKEGIYRAARLSEAMTRLALRHWLRFGLARLAARERDALAASLFRVKAQRMAELYQEVFADLAREYRVTMVAGSTVLPAPEIRDGVLRAGRGLLHNLSVVFRPDGSPYPAIVRKAFPISDELPFMAPAPVSDLPVFETPAGRLGVLICADAWHPPAYASLREQRVDVIAVPSGILSRKVWNDPWDGYDGAPNPPDVDPADLNVISEREAWRKYALAGRLHEAGARGGVIAVLHGELWDLSADGGQSIAVTEDAFVEARSDGAALINLWL